ncbi:MAG: hypothetical protein EXR99_10905 [Gemmataceae bacterium]|nr:hypothetical protein [Gemmataceae bacterium]
MQAVKKPLRQAILAVYDSAEQEIARHGPVCQASGKCCRFKEYQHTLFLSNLEAGVLLKTAPPYAPPTDPAFCPFQKGSLCTAREERPLGCRVYFCDPAFQDKMPAITEKYVRQLKDLADEQDIPWRYAPLHHFLDHPEDACPL